MELGDFDDDFFECKPKRKTQDLTEIIQNYKPKIVTSEKFIDERPIEIDDLANWHKMKADYYYFTKNYENALEFYRESLDTSIQSSSLNNTIFQRELRESIARSLFRLGHTQEALELINQLHESSSNFEQYSTCLNVHLSFFESLNTENLQMYTDEQITILCKLLILHPWYVNLWMKLHDLLQLNSHNENNSNYKMFSVICLQLIREINKHGNSSNRSEIFAKQKLKQQTWFNEAIKMLDSNTLEKYFQDPELNDLISLKLETNDKLEDNEKLNQAKCLDTFPKFFNTWYKLDS
ncbi:unnamed protein product [Brachionus calyciflorus]|uniref:Uncharacterized protein n=1 Tax=Brachionus calyciflorus TaxID=104777 RepID=A0A813UWG9_9BILA|nr:unnamed protein product [Brachionus calyciflorus]